MMKFLVFERAYRIFILGSIPPVLKEMVVISKNNVALAERPRSNDLGTEQTNYVYTNRNFGD